MSLRTASPAVFLAAAFCAAAFAPQPPAAAPAAKAPPSWAQGRTGDSPLHPFAIHVTGKASKDLPIDKLKVPAGFKVEVWAEGLPNARSMALGNKGTVFVGTRQLKDVYAVVDRGGKREVKTLFKGMDTPNGIAFSKGTLYIAERNRITRYDGIEDRLDNPPEAKVVIDNLDPNKAPGHFWKFLAMGPDGKLYFNIGAPGNIVMPNYNEASIMRVNPNKGTLENVALGVRNSVGFDWHPKTGQLWFTNHARDWVSDDLPHDTLNRVTRKGMHFGYPFCHDGDFLDPEYGKGRDCKEFTPPALKLGAHIAPIGMRFYTGKMFPAEYQGNIFIALRGSWNRTIKQGYNVTRVILDEKGKPKAEPFLTGFLVDEKADPPMWGRPADVMQMRDGSLLVSDDHNGIIYRVSYAKK
jgi:glucose/arabinose dehydrogenase